MLELALKQNREGIMHYFFHDIMNDVLRYAFLL